jgi:hypothetical protein
VVPPQQGRRTRCTAAASEDIPTTSVRKSGIPNKVFVGDARSALSGFYDLLGHASTDRLTWRPACPRLELKVAGQQIASEREGTGQRREGCAKESLKRFD